MWVWLGLALLVVVAAVTVYDLTQKKHAILRNFPLVGHFRYLLESVGPELRQYIVTSNTEERPFSRGQRRWVYASAKKANNYFGFGTDERIEEDPNYLIIKHSTFGSTGSAAPTTKGHGESPGYPIPCAKVLGSARDRRHMFRPQSVVNISAMSFGSLSAAAVEAMNRGAKLAGCLHNTGEGGISPYHKNGGELMWQLGTGYFGCRDERGSFNMDRFLETVAENPVRAIEIKLSQGAKPGLGGVLPSVKVTPEIARIRGVPEGQDCISPPRHSAFHDADSLLDFVEEVAERSGLPVGIKSAIGELGFWEDLSGLMARDDRGVDFVTIDGGEGGTGAAPLVFTDHVALPFKLGMSRVYRFFQEAGIADDVVFIGSGKLGFPESGLLAFSLGCDMVAVAREAMMAIGCIQAQRCHEGNCPAGVATQNKWLMRGLDPTSKAARLANYVTTLRKELLLLSQTCGVEHPGLVTGDHLEILDGHFGSRTLYEVFGYEPGWGLPGHEDQSGIEAIMRGNEVQKEPVRGSVGSPGKAPRERMAAH